MRTVWLRGFGNIPERSVIVNCDRGGIYAEAARRAAPHAVQIADRWHLLRNLSEALCRAIAPHHRLFSQAARTGRSKPHRLLSLHGANASFWFNKPPAEAL
jgi:hypothetical protein